MYVAYSLLLAVAFVFAVPFYLWKGRGTGKYLSSFRERMGRLPATLAPAEAPSVWIHAVSVGEALTARILVAPLRRRLPGRRVYVSTTTATGRAVAERSVKGADGLFFAPFDWPGPVRSALDRVKPALLLLVETEIWPNLIHEAHRRGVRVAVVNGRISPRSFPRYRAARGLLRRVLSEVDLFLMQSEPHAARVLEIGAPPERVRALGNLKFDALESGPPPADLARALGPADGGRPLWIAGSTVAGEEALVLAAFRDVRARVSGARLLLAPRHPERFAEAFALAEAAGLRVRRRSELGAGPWDGDVLLLDTLGELARVYSLATVVFVGGSLVGAGGHNVLEAAAAGVPVLVGPHMENFQEIADELTAEHALLTVSSADELGREVAALMADPVRRVALAGAARAVLERNRGALARTIDAVSELVAQTTPLPLGGEGRVRG